MKFQIISLIIINALSAFSESVECDALVSFFHTFGYTIDNDCCQLPGITCNNNEIVSLELELSNKNIDFSKFPIFPKLEKFSIRGDVYQGEFPIDIFNQPSLTTIDLSNSNIQYISKSPINNKVIEEINLSNNKIESCSFLDMLPNLKTLNASNNEIDYFIFYDLPFSISTLILNNNNIAEVPDYIQNFNELKILELGSNNITEIHDYFFSLSNLEQINISHNPYLETKIIHFPNSPIQCELEGITVSCYEPDACSNDYSQYKKCSEEEIYTTAKPDQMMERSINNNKRLYTKALVMLCAVLIASYFVLIVYLQRKKSIERRNLANYQNSNNNNNNNNNRSDDDDILPSYQDAVVASQNDPSHTTSTINTPNSNDNIDRDIGLPDYSSSTGDIGLLNHTSLSNTNENIPGLPTYEEAVDETRDH